MEAASGVAQQMRMHDFEQPSRVAAHKAEAPSRQERAVGFFGTLSPRMQESLVEMARHERAGARKQAAIDKKEQLEYKAAKRGQNLQKLLNATIEVYANGLELFTAWKVRSIADEYDRNYS